MTAASDDVNLIQREGRAASYPVAAGMLIYAMALVALDSSGNAEPATDADGKTFVGVARDQVDNSSGAAGDETVTVDTGMDVLLTGSGFAATDVGKPVFVLDDQTVGKAGASGLDYAVRVGTITQFESSTEVWVRVEAARRATRIGEVGLFIVSVAGVNAGALNLAAAAAVYGGTGLRVQSVVAMNAYVTSTKASAGMKVATTNYIVASGAITTVTDESANTLHIALIGQLT